MKKFKFFFAVLTAAMLCSCATTERIAEGIATKNVTGNGTFIKTNVGIDPDSIFLMGGSQGGFVCSDVAGVRPDDVAGLVCLYPAYVLQDNAWKQTPDPDNIPETINLMGIALGGIYNRDAMSFDIYDIIRNYPGKVLILHGTADSIAPVSWSERAAEVFPDAELIRYEGANHGFRGKDEINSENQAIEFVRGILDAR